MTKPGANLFKWSIWLFALFIVAIFNGFAQAETPPAVLEKPKIEVPKKNVDQEEILKASTKEGQKRPVAGKKFHPAKGYRTKPKLKSGAQLDTGSDSSQGPSDTPTMGDGHSGTH